MRLILVPVANRPECARALQTAFDIARRLGASVYGCHIRRHRRNTRHSGAKNLYERIAGQNGYEVTRRHRKTPSAIWSEKGERLAQLGTTGAGVAVASEGHTGWRARAVMLGGD